MTEPSPSDVSVTQDVLMDIKKGRIMSIDAWNTRPIEDALRAEIDRLKSERRWIPVSEPPKKNGYYWCSIVDDAGCKWADKRLFSVENGWFTIGEHVTHWMPLPTPPEEK